MRITAEFIASSKGRIFAIARCPENFDGRCVLVVPPFAEEMNKSRKMIAELAGRLVEQGVGVVVPDFFGTGDSEGEFADTDVEGWLDDLHATESWMQTKGMTIDSILGVRLGCLMAAHFVQRRKAATANLIFWQPVLDGARAFEQFLRLRVAASLMEDKKETVADFKAQFAAGADVEVAGYSLSPALAAQMATLKLPSISAKKLYWFEILRSSDAAVPVANLKVIENLQKSEVVVELQTVIGQPFWATSEIACLPELLDSTASALSGGYQ